MIAGDLKDAQRPWVFKAIVATVPAGAQLLEIGAGEPLVAARLLRLGYGVTVIDPYDGRDGGPTGLESLRRAHPQIRIIRGVFPDDLPAGERFDCVYSISVLEHLQAEAIAATCAGVTRHTRTGGFSVHAIDHVLLGAGEADHRERLGAIAWAFGIGEAELDEVLDRLAVDPETYFLSAEGHDRWRAGAPYDEFPMRRCVSIQLCLPVGA